MKDAVIAKLANQAADFYGDAFKQCQYKDNLPKVSEGRALAHKHCSALKGDSNRHIHSQPYVQCVGEAYRVWILYGLACVLSV